MKKRLCKYNLYDEFEIKKGKGKKPVYLTECEIDKILKYTPTNDKLRQVKDLFVFQFFTGMAYIDVSKFDKSYVFERDGTEIISGNRSKTEESFVSLLLPEAKKIMELFLPLSAKKVICHNAKQSRSK